MLDSLWSDIQSTSFVEWLAVLLAIAYLTLAIRRNIWCWPCAFVSTMLYVYLFWDVKLPMESSLQVYYMLMAVYGFVSWRAVTAGATISQIKRYRLRTHLAAICMLFAVSLLTAFVLSENSDARMPFLDSLTTWSAVFATWLVAKREINNWYYWLVIDALLVFLCLRTGLALTALLYVLYLLMIPFGIISWRKVVEANGTA